MKLVKLASLVLAALICLSVSEARAGNYNCLVASSKDSTKESSVKPGMLRYYLQETLSLDASSANCPLPKSSGDKKVTTSDGSVAFDQIVVFNTKEFTGDSKNLGYVTLAGELNVSKLGSNVVMGNWTPEMLTDTSSAVTYPDDYVEGDLANYGTMFIDAHTNFEDGVSPFKCDSGTNILYLRNIVIWSKMSWEEIQAASPCVQSAGAVFVCKGDTVLDNPITSSTDEVPSSFTSDSYDTESTTTTTAKTKTRTANLSKINIGDMKIKVPDGIIADVGPIVNGNTDDSNDDDSSDTTVEGATWWCSGTASGSGSEDPTEEPTEETETDCDDGVDNDEDTYIDCNDSDCSDDDACTGATETDADADGQSVEDGDCDDSNSSVNTSAEETCDGLDNDCDDSIDEGFEETSADVDGDGTLDCADVEDSTVDEASCSDGLDNDGDGLIDTDDTGCPSEDTGADISDTEDCTDGEDNTDDGYTDCDDADCTGTDACPIDEDDDDDAIDEDGDGFSTDEDCDDANAMINSEEDEVCGDGLDNDCDEETTDEEADGLCTPSTDISIDTGSEAEGEGGCSCNFNANSLPIGTQLAQLMLAIIPMAAALMLRRRSKN